MRKIELDESLCLILKEFVTSPLDLRVESIQKRGWTVVPSFGSEISNPEFQERLCTIARRLGYTEITAIPTDEDDAISFAVQVELEVVDIERFSMEFGMFSWLLVFGDIRFALLITIADYCLLAGPSSLLEELTSSSVEGLLSEFKSFIDGIQSAGRSEASVQFIESERQRYTEILERYSNV